MTAAHAADRRHGTRPRTPTGERLTAIVNTFKRPDLLRASVAHFSQCAAVARVHVNWAESLEPPVDLSDSVCCGTPLTVALPLATRNDSSLNTRFLPVPGMPLSRRSHLRLRIYACALWCIGMPSALALAGHDARST